MVLIFLMLPFAANIVVLPPPLDMAKEAICALLAIFGRFFGFFFLVHMGNGGGGQARCQAGRRDARQSRQGWELAGSRRTAGWRQKAIPGRKTITGRTAITGGRQRQEGQQWQKEGNDRRTAMTGRKPGEAQERPARTLSRPLLGANEAADGERQCLRKFHLELSLLISNLPSVGVLSAMEMSVYFSSVPGTLLGMILYVPSVSCSILQSCSGAPVN